MFIYPAHIIKKLSECSVSSPSNLKFNNNKVVIRVGRENIYPTVFDWEFHSRFPILIVQAQPRLVAELVEHVEHPVLATIVGAILDEVIGPDLIALLRPQPDARSVGQPEPAALGLLMGDLQPLALPDTLDPFVVDCPARLAQQFGDLAIAIAAEIDREIKQIKLGECRKHLGALNYPERMAEIGERAFADYFEALARLYAIALGLREFYSVNVPDLNDIKKSRTRIEGAVKWIRTVTNAFARAGMNEQSGVVRLTVRSSENDTLFKKLMDGLPLTFPADLIANMTRPRLRGISATAEGVPGDGWIDLEIACPEQKLSSVEIVLPSVTARLGRVSSSASLNVRDIAGGRPIVNRFPVGNWKVRAVNHDRAEQINGLHLDFHLAFCSE